MTMPSKPRLGQPLTPRELEMLTLLALGLTGPEIATKKWLSLNTVKTHLKRAYAKLGARTSAQAVALCFQRGHLLITEQHPKTGRTP